MVLYFFPYSPFLSYGFLMFFSLKPGRLMCPCGDLRFRSISALLWAPSWPFVFSVCQFDDPLPFPELFPDPVETSSLSLINLNLLPAGPRVWFGLSDPFSVLNYCMRAVEVLPYNFFPAPAY